MTSGRIATNPTVTQNRYLSNTGINCYCDIALLAYNEQINVTFMTFVLRHKLSRCSVLSALVTCQCSTCSSGTLRYPQSVQASKAASGRSLMIFVNSGFCNYSIVVFLCYTVLNKIFSLYVSQEPFM